MQFLFFEKFKSAYNPKLHENHVITLLIMYMEKYHKVLTDKTLKVCMYYLEFPPVLQLCTHVTLEHTCFQPLRSM